MLFLGYDSESSRSGLGFVRSIYLSAATAVVVSLFVSFIHMLLTGDTPSVIALLALFFMVLLNICCLMLLPLRVITSWWFSMLMGGIYIIITLSLFMFSK